jgi:hypothetical protein
MPVYVAAIAGRSIAAFHAEDGSHAASRMRDRLFRDDLMALASGGLALWNGVTDLDVHEAPTREAAKWHASRARAVRLGNIESEDDTWIAFLVPLTDSSR